MFKIATPPCRALCLLAWVALGGLAGATAHGDAGEDLARGIEFFEAGRFAEAREVLTPLGDAEAKFYLGRLAFLERNLDAAQHRFEEAAEQAPANASYQFWLGRTFGAQATAGGALGRGLAARRSKSLFEKALELDPEHLEARYGLLRFHLLAPRLLGASREEARRQAKEIDRRDHYAGRLAWAAIHEADEDWRAAEAAYENALVLRPGAPDAVLRLVWLCQRQKRFAKAFTTLDSLLRVFPEHTLALYETGRTAAFSGLRLESGRQALEAYLQHRPRGTEPTKALAYFHLGMIRRHEGRDDLAAREFRRALALDPLLDEARRNLQEVED